MKPLKGEPLKAASAPAPVHFRVEAASLKAHLWSVTMQIEQPAAKQTLQMPVWIPGSYMVREFSKHLQHLECYQAGRKIAHTAIDKASWLALCDPTQTLEVRYQVYALDDSVRTSWLDSARGFFNATSLCLMAPAHRDQTHTLEIVANPDMRTWRVATGLRPIKTNARGFGLYRADNYDELADCPFELGPFWRGEFMACGVLHEMVVASALPSFDGERLLKDTQKICETEINFWHNQGQTTPSAVAQFAKRVPFGRYVFMLNAVNQNYGGLEHRNSTALIAARKDLPRKGDAKTSEGYVTLLGLISHEYFHTWNVKRLRPAELTKIDYSRENYTELLWFFEGFTSYFDDLLLRRSGLIDDATYFKLLTKTANQVLQSPGRKVQTVAQASRDAWVKYYRQDENTPNATISYYSKGALVALCIDLRLREEKKGSLDDAMRALWQRCAGGPMTESDLTEVLQLQTGRSWAKEIKSWVHSTAELPLEALLATQHIGVAKEPAQMAQRLGIRVEEGKGAVHIKHVLRASAAEAAGLCAGDEWLAIEVGQWREGGQGSAWKLDKLEDLTPLLGPQLRCIALVSRDKRLLRLPLSLPRAVSTWRLHASARAAHAWPRV